MTTSKANKFPANRSLCVDLELSKRLERAEALANRRYIEAKQKAFPNSDAAWTEIGGAYAMFDTAQSPLTQTFGLGAFETPTDDHFDQLEKFFTDRGASVFHEISPVPDQSLLGKLRERGYYPIELTNLLYRTIDENWTVESSPALKVREVQPDEHDAYSKLSAKGWELPPEFATFFEDFGKITAKNEHVASFIVERDGKPIGCGGLCLSGDIALIAGDCTLPEARGQGGQLALIAARIQYARQRGYNLMMMGALPGSTSQKNGQRAGMNIAYTRIKWAKS